MPTSVQSDFTACLPLAFFAQRADCLRALPVQGHRIFITGTLGHEISEPGRRA
jgi:hypothetical protein